MLHTAQALILQADKADHIRREGIVWIVTLCLILETEAVAIALLTNDRAHCLVFIVLKPSLDPDKAAANSNIVENLPLREAEDGRNIGSNLRRIMRVIDMVWIDKKGFCHTADRELFAVAVENRTAQGLNAELVAALITHPLRECIPLNHLQIGIAECQDHEHDKHEQRNTRNASLHRCPNIFHWIALPPISRIIPLSSYHKRVRKKSRRSALRRSDFRQ